MAVGENEVKRGLNSIKKKKKKYGLPLISTNILERGTGRTIAGKYAILDIGGKKTLLWRFGGKKIGIFSVILPHFIYNSIKSARDFEVVDSKIAALEAVSHLRTKGCDLVIAICHEGWNKSLELASSVEGIDIVINGHRAHEKPYSERVGKTLVVDTGEKRTTFTEILVTFTSEGISSRALDAGKEVLKIERDNEFQKMYDEYEAALKKAGLSN